MAHHRGVKHLNKEYSCTYLHHARATILHGTSRCALWKIFRRRRGITYLFIYSMGACNKAFTVRGVA